MKKLILSLALMSGLLMGVPVHGSLLGSGKTSGTSSVPTSSNSQAMPVPCAWLPRIAALTGIPLGELVELRVHGHVKVNPKGTITVFRVACRGCGTTDGITELTVQDL
jgi:hypothetical protein